MRKIAAREYKVMLDPERFQSGSKKVARLWRSIRGIARAMKVGSAGRFHQRERRSIRFLDTSGRTLEALELILRERKVAGKRPEYTLKCRSPDRYIAAGFDTSAAARIEAEDKFEEHIGAPFRSRYSRSTTARWKPKRAKARKGKRQRGANGKGENGTIGGFAELFPALGRLERHGETVRPDTPLRQTSRWDIREEVVKGPRLTFGRGKEKLAATVALILWHEGTSGSIRCAELSFRVGCAKRGMAGADAASIRAFFARVQELDWCLPESPTKTSLALGTSAATMAGP